MTFRPLAVLTLTAVVAFGATSVAGAESTVVTFDVAAGSLSITQGAAGADVDLGATSFNLLSGTSVEGDLNDITVTDNQSLVGTWCVSVTLSDGNTVSTPAFVLDASNEVNGSNAVMWVNGLSIGSGLITNTTTAISEVTGVSMATGGVLAQGATALGGGSLTYTPHLKVTVPAGTAVGTYSGTITHTASTTC